MRDIELPLEQQQDFVCLSIHTSSKVYRSWATTPAVPPWLEGSGGGRVGKRLRWLAEEPPKMSNGRSTTELSRHQQTLTFLF